MYEFVLMLILLISCAPSAPCPFFLFFLFYYEMKNKMVKVPELPEICYGDYVVMTAGKFRGRVGFIMKPTRLMAWIAFEDQAERHTACLLKAHMEVCDPPPTTDDRSTLEEDSLNHEDQINKQPVRLTDFLDLETRVENLVAQLKEQEDTMEARVEAMKKTLMGHMKKEMDEWKLKGPKSEE